MQNQLCYPYPSFMSRMVHLYTCKGEVAVLAPSVGVPREHLIESKISCYDAQMMTLYLGSNPVLLTVLGAKSEEGITAPRRIISNVLFVIVLMGILFF